MLRRISGALRREARPTGDGHKRSNVFEFQRTNANVMEVSRTPVEGGRRRGKMTRRTPTSKLPEIEFPVLEEMSDGEEVSDEQLERPKEGLPKAIAPAHTGLNKNEMIIGRDHYLLLKKMEDYAQDLAELVVRYFKEKDLDVRKDLILKSVEVLKLNPPPGPGSAINHGRS